jgi:hypothetical protein
LKFLLSRPQSRQRCFVSLLAMTWREVMPGKRVEIDDATWASLNLLGKDRSMTFQGLFDEAIRDL